MARRNHFLFTLDAILPLLGNVVTVAEGELVAALVAALVLRDRTGLAVSLSRSILSTHTPTGLPALTAKSK